MVCKQQNILDKMMLVRADVGDNLPLIFRKLMIMDEHDRS